MRSTRRGDTIVNEDIDAAVDRAFAALGASDKVRMLSGQDYWTLPAVPSAGLRSLVMSDGPVGVRGTGWAPDSPEVALPAPIALAATWDVRLARDAGRVVGAAARRRGVDLLLAPMVNMHRSPLAGRHFECYSEDPTLAGTLAAQYVLGVQDMGVGATAKALVANDSETERLTVDVRVSERALREVYLAPFEAIVRQARPWAVMAAYNRVNGIRMTEHPALLSAILKDEWGFDGVVVSDWTAARSTVETALGGLDVVMPADGSPWGSALLAAVEDGRVPAAVLDDKVRRALLLAVRAGALAGVPARDIAVAAPEPEAAAREIAVRSFVLATNDGVLPLRSERLRRVAVVGTWAAAPRTQGGGSAEIHARPGPPPLAALADALGPQVEVAYAEGTDPRPFLTAAGGPQWTRPDGEPGLTGTLRARDGRELHRAALDAATVRWMGSYPGAGADTVLATIELAGRLTPRAGGAHRFAVSGFGVFTLRVAGRVAWHGPLYPPGTDPANVFLGSAERRVEVHLAAGRPVDVSLTQHVTDERATAFVAMTLGHAPPVVDPERLLADAVDAAARADVAVVFVGTTEGTETETADRETLGLPGRQDELVARVAAANLKTIVVVGAGAPVLMPWAPSVAAVLLTWFAGDRLGAAIADVLLGLAEPGGRLPVTWPAREVDCPVLSTRPEQGTLRYDEDTLVGYRGWAAAGRNPLFAFGHGLGYTTWAYERISVVPGAGLCDVEVRVRNTGSRAGREVVQVYLAARDGRDTWAPPRLAGFAVVEAGPGQAASVRVALPERAAQTWDDGWRRIDGPLRIAAGRSVADLRLHVEVTFDVTGEVVGEVVGEVTGEVAGETTVGGRSGGGTTG
jgi:beta-glucosidase